MESKQLGSSRLFVIIFTVFVDLIGFGIIIPLLPFYANKLGADPTTLGLLIAVFSLMQFLFSPVLGRLSDRFGRRPVLLVSLIFSVLGHLMFALSNSIPLLFISRTLAGIAGANLSVAQAYIADTTALKDRAKGMGLIGASFGVGFIIGPVIGGIFSQYGLSVPGFVAAIISFFNFLAAFAMLPETLTPEHRLARSKLAPTERGFLSNLKKPVVGELIITFFIVNFAFSNIPVIFPLLGISRFNLSPSDMAMVFIYIGFIHVIIQAGLIGKLVRKFGEEFLLMVGTFSMMLAIFLTPFATQFLLFIILAGFTAAGVALIITSVPSLVSKKTPVEEHGSILGVTQSAASFGRVLGPLMGGLVFQYGGVSTPYYASAAVMIVGFVLCVRIYNNNKQSKSVFPLSNATAPKL